MFIVTHQGSLLNMNGYRKFAVIHSEYKTYGIYAYPNDTGGGLATVAYGTKLECNNVLKEITAALQRGDRLYTVNSENKGD